MKPATLAHPAAAPPPSGASPRPPRRFYCRSRTKLGIIIIGYAVVRATAAIPVFRVSDVHAHRRAYATRVAPHHPSSRRAWLPDGGHARGATTMATRSICSSPAALLPRSSAGAAHRPPWCRDSDTRREQCWRSIGRERRRIHAARMACKTLLALARHRAPYAYRRV